MPGPVRASARFAVDRVPGERGSRGLRYPRWAKRFMTFAELPEEARFRRSYTLYDPEDLASLVGPDLESQVGQVVDEHSAVYTDNELDDEINRMCLADSRLFMAGLNLAYTDRSSMAASVEVRVPFVDPVVARAAFSIRGGDIDPGLAGQARTQAGCGELAAERRIVYGPKASFSARLWVGVRNDLRVAYRRCAGRRRVDRVRDDPLPTQYET